MPKSSKELRPLMDSILKMLKDIEGHELPSFLKAKDVADLRAKYHEYADCCCMQAHVIPDRDEDHETKKR